ncbi:MAG: polyprenol monophosphomannose synthase, partial [Anaerolineales bacterium]
MTLTIVIPTYNEAQNLPKLINALFSLPIDGLNVIVVDDNSPDGTGRVAERMIEAHPGQISVMHRAGKLGLGTAYIRGFRQALDHGSQAIAQMDADLSHPPEMLLVLLDALSSSDVAMGSRYVEGGSVDVNWSYRRKTLSAFGNYYARSILGLPVRDATGGFKIWRRNTLLGMPLERVRASGYAFQVEMAYIAYLLGYTFQEEPFYFADRSLGRSKMSFRIQLEAAIRVWQMLFDYRDLKYRNMNNRDRNNRDRNNR